MSIQPDASFMADIFFSPRNVSTIQDAIISVILHTHGVKTDPQPASDITRIMRSIYFAHDKNVFNTDISTMSRTISEMNELVVRDSVQLIDGEMSMNIKYNEDFGKVRTPLPHPVNASRKGERSLEMRM